MTNFFNLLKVNLQKGFYTTYKSVIDNEITSKNNYFKDEIQLFHNNTNHFFNIASVLGTLITIFAVFLTWFGFNSISKVKKTFEEKFTNELENEKTKMIIDFKEKLEGFYTNKEIEFEEIKTQIVGNTQSIIESNTKDLHVLKNEFKNKTDMKEDERIQELQKQVDFIKKYGKETDETRYSQGLLFYQQKDYIKAIIEFNRSLELNDKHFYSLHYRGHSYIHLKEYENALNDFLSIKEQNPSNSGNLFNIGYTHGLLKNYKESLKYYNEVIDIDPNDIQAYQNMIEIHLLNGELTKSENLLKTLFSLNNKTSQIFINLYLKCILFILRDKSIIKLENEIEKFRKLSFTSNWSFNDIEDWISNQNQNETKIKK